MSERAAGASPEPVEASVVPVRLFLFFSSLEGNLPSFWAAVEMLSGINLRDLWYRSKFVRHIRHYFFGLGNFKSRL